MTSLTALPTPSMAYDEFAGLAAATPAAIDITQHSIIPERQVVLVLALDGAVAEITVGGYGDFARWRRLVELAGILAGFDAGPLPLCRARDCMSGDEIAVAGTRLADVVAVKVAMPAGWMP